MRKNTLSYVLTYAISIAVPLLVGLTSAYVTMGNMDLYPELTAPPLAPPAWLFPIVWTVLYILMGVSCAMVLTHRSRDEVSAKKGIKLYAVSLALNFGWSIIFFNNSAYFAALIWLLLLLYTVVRYALFYRKVSPIAAILQLPYILWLIFAAYLNAGIWLLN